MLSFFLNQNEILQVLSELSNDLAYGVHSLLKYEYFKRKVKGTLGIVNDGGIFIPVSNKKSNIQRDKYKINHKIIILISLFKYCE